MNVFKGIAKLFGKRPCEVLPELTVERVQCAMLSALECHCEALDPSLDTRISRAKDLNDLWYLRPNLMFAISADKGELVAQGVLAEITRLFDRPGQEFGLARR
jgi:hypothetical protein